jgi:signal transduction histidine kinase
VNKSLTDQKEELSQTLQELKKAQNQLIESEKMASLGILTAGVAHEINNPLNYIQAGIYGIESFFEDSTTCQSYCNNHSEITNLLDRMKIGVLRVSGIVTSLNHFSRQTESKTENCDIHAIIDNCLLILNHQYKFNIDIQKKYENKKFNLKGNEGKLHQVFLNIIGNAVQSIDQKGMIEINTMIDNDMFKVSVKDTGCGIMEENLKRIFDPFFTTKEPGLGTGLGLSITYGIIKEHSGHIEYKSEPGKGTEVIISLPVQQ